MKNYSLTDTNILNHVYEIISKNICFCVFVQVIFAKSYKALGIPKSAKIVDKHAQNHQFIDHQNTPQKISVTLPTTKSPLKPKNIDILRESGTANERVIHKPKTLFNISESLDTDLNSCS